MTLYNFTVQAEDELGRFATLASSISLAEGDPIAQSIGEKMLHWWDFDGNAIDAIDGNVLSGSATYQAGHIGQKVVKGEVLLSELLSTAGMAPGVSFGGWIYIDGTGNENPIVLKIGPGNSTSFSQSHYLAVRSSGTQLFLVGYPASGGNVSISTLPGSMALGNWYFIVGSVSPTGAMKLYLNGAPVVSGSIGNPPKSYSHLQFGNSLPTVFSALHNDASFVSHELTDAEVLWLYNSGAGRSGSEITSHIPNLRSHEVGQAAWTWFNDARAIQAGDQLVVGGVNEAGQIRAFYSIDGFSSPGATFDFTGTYVPDDHDNPAFLRRSDGKILVFYTRHSDPDCWMRVSDNDDDASAWGAAVNLQPQIGAGPYSYNNPIQLTGEAGEPIYNFFRRGSSPTFTLNMSKSEDGGATWTAAQALMGGGRPYFKVIRNGDDRIDFLVTDGHPREVSTNSVYHFYYQGGAYYDSDGVSIGAPPLSTANMTMVFDGSTADGRAWVWDIQIAPDGHPVVVYSRFPTTTDHRYMYAKWNGSAWVGGEICAAGGYLYAEESYYSGGVCIDPDDVTKVYACREVAGGWGLYRYATADGGTSWDAGTKLYQRGAGKTFRPTVVPGSDYVLFCTGTYTSYINYNVRIRALPIAR